MRLLALVFSALLILPSLANPIFLRKGDEVSELTTKSGKVHKGVRVSTISAKGITVISSTGVTRIPRAELPGYEHIFRKFDTAAGEAERESASEESIKQGEVSHPDLEALVAEDLPLEWAPKSLNDIVTVCLKVEVSKGVDEFGRKVKWVGSAFLCNEQGVTYIYSNLHNFFGAKEFRFVYQDGRVIPEAHLGRVDVADGKYGLFVKSYGLPHGWGGDVVRIRLRKFYPQALQLDRTLLSTRFVGKDIAVVGNQGGRGAITKLTGKLTAVEKHDIIMHNARTEPGNSGSPIIDLDSMKVIGILTWGMRLPDPVRRVWSKVGEEEREGINSGASLSRITFSSSSFDKLYEERLLINRMKSSVRLLGLMDALVPSAEGLFVDTSVEVMGGFTIADLLAESPDHYIVKRLLKLDKEIREGNRGVRISNMDLLKLYSSAYRDCLAYTQRQTRAIKDRMYTRSYFFECSVKNTFMLEISRAYENGIARSIQWYRKQGGLSKKAIPLTERVRLPRLDSGLQGLGIQRE
ncbi:hypothetical protein Rhal01_03635 [Rubritalea halochordaticola]|uniref:Serine protease n=1 Tax=Rubritalea halochordaticola TaxID=714537 RepID=A0ABP9V6B6_9BACT